MTAHPLEGLREVIQKHWGFASFRPLQQEAMEAVLQGRDSLVVMPTGGGKSLCFQAPAVLRGDTTVVISPLIALMKDQVDSLRSNGIAAIQFDSSISLADRMAYETDVRQGRVRLLFCSPERLMMPDFGSLLRAVNIKTFAIDEAHCISHWGHDFRPEYRQMSRIKELFPSVNVHAYTATATEQVRDDICRQLKLRNPAVLVGDFDRPNLTYRVIPRFDLEKQVREVLDRHPSEAGIIYCIRRRDVEEIATMLRGMGFKALAYHAGMTPDDRRRAQDAFATEECDLMVATVAFGMGIDRSNIRFVMHTGMPKSIEHYQQETGRAGRDGLEAECVLLYTGSDFMTWRSIVEKSAAEKEVAADFLPNALAHLDDMYGYCRSAVCRHRALVNHFGQNYENPSCGSCDVCLGDVEEVPDATVVAQKILSCVARVQERFGAGHVISVLRGENTDRVRTLQHDQLSVYALMQDQPKTAIRDWIFQLVGQGVLMSVGDEYPVLKLNAASWEVMKGRMTVKLVQPAQRGKGEKAKSSRAEATSWEGVDRGLFDHLKRWRLEQAKRLAKPAYIILDDNSLRELARVRPSTSDTLRKIYGVGEAKMRDYGALLLELLNTYCEKNGLSRDEAAAAQPAPAAKSSSISAVKMQAFRLFREGLAVEDVMHQTQRARSTISDYLAEFIRVEKPDDISHWISDAQYRVIEQAAAEHGGERLKPVFEALGGAATYDEIRLVLSHLNRGATE